jgi:hypothetical protein
MIDVNELRIGNLIYFPFHKEEVKIVGIALKEDGRILIQVETKGGILAEPITVFKPIILTEERLLMLGAKKEVLDAGSGIGFYDSYSIGDYELSRVFINMWGIIGIDCKPIKYVHQIQNLYFALKNIELQSEN